LLLQSRLSILLGERDPTGANVEGENRVGFLCTNARDLGRKIELRERRIKWADCLAFEVSHRRLDVLVAGLIIGAKEHHPLEALVGHIFADRCGPIIAGQRHNKTVLAAILASKAQWPGERTDGEDAGFGKRLPYGHHGIGGGKAGDEINLGILDQFRSNLDGFRGV